MQPPSRRRIAIVNSLPILLVTLVAMGLIAIIALQTVRSVRSSSETALTACNGEANPRLAPYAPTSGIHPIVAYRQLEDGSFTPDNAVVDVTWLPDDVTETELVLCMAPAQELTLPRCAAPDAEPVLYGYGQPVALVAASTGETLATDIVDSVPPPGERCIDDVDALSAPRRPTDLQIRAWLTPYVFIS